MRAFFCDLLPTSPAHSGPGSLTRGPGLCRTRKGRTLIRDISETHCSRNCGCFTPFGICRSQYRCEHHRLDYDRARAKAMRTALEYSIRQSWPHEAPER